METWILVHSQLPCILSGIPKLKKNHDHIFRRSFSWFDCWHWRWQKVWEKLTGTTDLKIWAIFHWSMPLLCYEAQFCKTCLAGRQKIRIWRCSYARNPLFYHKKYKQHRLDCGPKLDRTAAANSVKIVVNILQTPFFCLTKPNLAKCPFCNAQNSKGKTWVSWHLCICCSLWEMWRNGGR